jgi:hypothetical protein
MAILACPRCGLVTEILGDAPRAELACECGAALELCDDERQQAAREHLADTICALAGDLAAALVG